MQEDNGEWAMQFHASIQEGRDDRRPGAFAGGRNTYCRNRNLPRLDMVQAFLPRKKNYR